MSRIMGFLLALLLALAAPLARATRRPGDPVFGDQPQRRLRIHVDQAG